MNSEQIAYHLIEQLITLKASHEFEPYEGLIVKVFPGKIVLFSDYRFAELARPQETLEALQIVTPIDWSDRATAVQGLETIWGVIQRTGGH